MQITVDDTPVALPVDPGQTPVVQNLGPGVLYLDFKDDVSVGSGFEVVVNAAYEFPKDLPKTLYAVATVETDVRILVVG